MDYKKLKKQIRSYKEKREILNKKKQNKLNIESYVFFEKLGFSVRYDKEKNMYLMDNKHNTRMYTNIIKKNSLAYRRAENEYYLIEFIVKNNQLINFKLYEKQLGKENPYRLKHVYKQKEDK